jgi:hypothetical protein
MRQAAAASGVSTPEAAALQSGGTGCQTCPVQRSMLGRRQDVDMITGGHPQH